MASYRLALLLVVALAASAIAAPLDETAGQSNKDATTTVASATTTTSAGAVASSTTAELAASSTASPAVEPSSTPAQQTAPTPSTDSSSTGATESLAASPAHDIGQNISISFTCYGRNLGYYADIETKCKVYHFCLLGEYNGDPIYQRVSYMCVHDKVFDQQALDCVEESKLKAPCKDSTTYYDISNKVLRQAVLSGHSVSDSDLTKANNSEAHKTSGSTEATA